MLESGTAFRLGDLVKSLQTTRTLSDELLDQLSTTSAEVDELARKQARRGRSASPPSPWNPAVQR
jgi:hypothetical protein